MLRRSPRSHETSKDENTKSPSPTTKATPPRGQRGTVADDGDSIKSNDESGLFSDEEPSKRYLFGGVSYNTYQEMVDAKRKRNQQVLLESGLLSAAGAMKKTNASTRQNKKRKEDPTLVPLRKSNRLAGIEADNRFIEEERAGRFTIVAGGVVVGSSSHEEQQPNSEHYRDRINDGSDLSVPEAVQKIGFKWLQESSVSNSELFVKNTLQPHVSAPSESHHQLNGAKSKSGVSPRSVIKSPQVAKSHLVNMIQSLSVDDENLVAKVTPERIYGIACHPSTDKLVVCAGDKNGFVGIWDVESRTSSTAGNDGVHLFRFHSGAACCLQWTPSGSALFSTSYDGTVRWFDVISETFQEIFATFDSTDQFKGKLGYSLDSGHHFWTQYGCLDDRFYNEKCFFLSTSTGSAMHIDLRLPGKERITFQAELSEKKINTLSLHPSHNYLISGGLDNTVKLWDLRKLAATKGRSSGSSIAEPVSYYESPKSINSAFVSPSGRYIVCTTMHDRLDILHDMHLTTGLLNPNKAMWKSIKHDNKTGRWLSTFMARFHPSLDLFCVGSMQQPRAVELFDPSDGGTCLRAITGEAMKSVASRCCFHPSPDQLILVGGNSSGRVTVIR